MENLNLILKTLKERKSNFDGDYHIPHIWNSFGFKDFSIDPGREGEIKLNPYDFMIECIETQFLNPSSQNGSQDFSVGNINNSVIYSMFVRMFTTWNHYDEKNIPGTFLKAICLLPYLKRMNVNIIYLLPIFKYSLSNRRGDTGSPYSIKNVYELDESLHDTLLGEDSSLVKHEFKAFIEACHILGIGVMVDFVFRTVARDSDLIVDHPEWFYWIPKNIQESFCAPNIDSIKKQTCVSESLVSKIYSNKATKKYLEYFTLPPNVTDPHKWSDLLKTHKDTGRNILELIEEYFSITTAPGFSDVINDSQPPWSDVTYLKFYHDNHEKAAPFLKKDQAPYVLFDIAKLSLFKGKQQIQELWDYTTNAIPFYQKEYGIDGARIDMGHALPQELNREMIRKTKEINPEFLLWSEEFNYMNSKKAKDDGFQFMTGSLWSEYKSLERPSFYKNVVSKLLESSLPITGALESPDTPRAAYNYKTQRNLEFMTIINNFMPNVVPMINNGFEIMETQPMNLGLDNTEEGRFVLPKEDPMYGKLAFFDNYRLHWTIKHSRIMPDFLNKAFELRKKFDDFLGDKNNFIYLPHLEQNKKLIVLCFRNNNKGKIILIIGNRSETSSAIVNFKKIVADISNTNEISLIYRDRDYCDSVLSFENSLSLSPKEIIIGTI